ncbi:MAG: hypothetical protein GXP04_14455 [Alphaproteobacteria bacterium]|nr:hypothetical protein [Alphaproteobacteria bacterium]
MKTSTIALIAFAGVFATASAFAHNHEGKGEMKMDMAAKADAHFAEVDADGDGSITEAEFLAYKMAKAKAAFAEIAGEDGVISADEAKAHHAAKMEKHKAMMEEHGQHGMKKED